MSTWGLNFALALGIFEKDWEKEGTAGSVYIRDGTQIGLEKRRFFEDTTTECRVPAG